MESKIQSLVQRLHNMSDSLAFSFFMTFIFFSNAVILFFWFIYYLLHRLIWPHFLSPWFDLANGITNKICLLVSSLLGFLVTFFLAWLCTSHGVFTSMSQHHKRSCNKLIQHFDEDNHSQKIRISQPKKWGRLDKLN